MEAPPMGPCDNAQSPLKRSKVFSLSRLGVALLSFAPSLQRHLRGDTKRLLIC
jgi:hypothetical protein